MGISSLGWLEFPVLLGGCFDELQDPMHWLKIRRLSSYFGMKYHCGIYKPMHREKKGSSREEVTFAKVQFMSSFDDLPSFRNILMRTREMMEVCCSRRLLCCRVWCAISGAEKEELLWRTSYLTTQWQTEGPSSSNSQLIIHTNNE